MSFGLVGSEEKIFEDELNVPKQFGVNPSHSLRIGARLCVILSRSA